MADKKEIKLFWDNGKIEKCYTLTPDLCFTSDGVDYVGSDWEKNKEKEWVFPCLIREGNLIYYGRQIKLKAGDEIDVDSEPYQDNDTEFEFVTPKTKVEDGFGDRFDDAIAEREEKDKEKKEKIERIKEKIKAKKEGIKLEEDVIDMVDGVDKRPDKLVKSEPKDEELDKVIDDSPGLKDALDKHEVKKMGDKKEKEKEVSEMLEMIDEVDEDDPEDDGWLGAISDKHIKKKKADDKPKKTKKKKKPAKTEKDEKKKEESTPKRESDKDKSGLEERPEIPADTDKEKSHETEEEDKSRGGETKVDEGKPPAKGAKSFARAAYDAEFTAKVLAVIAAEKKVTPPKVEAPMLEGREERVEISKPVEKLDVGIRRDSPLSDLHALEGLDSVDFLRGAKFIQLFKRMTPEQLDALYTVAETMVAGT